MRRQFWFVVVLSVIGLTAGTATQVQSDQHASMALPLAVDGSLAPERIPDFIAYRHFAIVASTGQVPSRPEMARRELMVNEMGLDGPDRRAFSDVFNGLRETLEDVDRRIADASISQRSDAAADLARLRPVKTRLLDTAVKRLLEQLSAPGKEKLHVYVLGMKRGIKIYGEMPQPPAFSSAQ